MNDQNEKKASIEDLSSDEDLVTITGGASGAIAIAVDQKLLKSLDQVSGVPGVIDPVSPVADSIGVSVGCVSWSKDYNKVANPGDLVTNPGQVGVVRGAP